MPSLLDIYADGNINHIASMWTMTRTGDARAVPNRVQYIIGDNLDAYADYDHDEYSYYCDSDY